MPCFFLKVVVLSRTCDLTGNGCVLGMHGVASAISWIYITCDCLQDPTSAAILTDVLKNGSEHAM